MNIIDEGRKVPRILHVFPTFAVGGAQARFCTIANHFGQAFEHIIVAMDDDLSCKERLDPELTVAFLKVNVRKGATFSNVRLFRQILKHLQPDLLVTSNFGSVEWAISNLWPVTRHVHMEDGFGIDEQVRQVPRRRLIRSLVLQRSTVVLPSSQLTNLARKTWHLPEHQTVFIPNGVNLSRFERCLTISDNSRTDGPVIGTVAALRPEKNLTRLLYAFASVYQETNAQLIIVGDGVERTKLEELVHRLKLSEVVKFTGHLNETQAAYKLFDVFVMSSDTEQMPFSVLEAMASGLPLVSTDVGEVSNMVSPSNRRFVLGNDHATLAHSLREVLSDPQLSRRLGDENRLHVEKYHSETEMCLSHRKLWMDGMTTLRPLG
jgi:glycosyltransferase involved in cell wall biosynthesis